ncbi:MAG: sugar phosphate isomerase/epimerase [Cryobacterium sp.]|nr:sugar phosphate isomerase/epimerase [Cryobacterium sp.]
MSAVDTASVTWQLSGFGDEIDPDPAIQLAVLQALGAAHIEVRSCWSTNIVDLDAEQLTTLGELVRSTGMGVSAIASPIGKVSVELAPEHEVGRLRRVIAAAQQLHTRYIRIFSFYPAEGRGRDDARDAVLHRLSLLATEAQSAGVVLLHENEKGIYGDTPARVLDLVESVGSPALRLAWDAANFVQVGVERPHDAAYALLRPHLEYLQIKDARLADGAVVPAGEGDGQLAATIAALAADGYRGFVSLEPHLAEGHELGGFSGPRAFGIAARALAQILNQNGVNTR